MLDVQFATALQVWSLPTSELDGGRFWRLRPDAKDRVTLRSANTEITVNPGLGAA